MKTTNLKHEAYYLFDGGINEENTKDLISFINNSHGNLMITMKSGGGCSGVGRLITRILNEHSDRISLTAMVGVYSAAFRLFYNFKGRRLLTPETKGMFHIGNAQVTRNINGSITYYEDEALLRNHKIDWPQHKEFAKSFMTKAEFNKFLRGKEVYFDFGRMVEIFPDAEII